MDETNKKKLSNEKRLKALKEWQKPKQQAVPVKNIHIKYELLEDNSAQNSKFNIFDGTDDDSSDVESNFRIRPQFEGKKGHELLTMSSEFIDRFKLDERFKEDNEVNFQNEEVKNVEKIKNIKILESILGYEVNEKYPEGKSDSMKKKLKRYDPKDESCHKYIKVQEPIEKLSKKEKKIRDEIDEESDKAIPTTTERYVEVSSNLKDILNCTSTPFAFSHTFNDTIESYVKDGQSSLSTPERNPVRYNDIKNTGEKKSLQIETSKYNNQGNAERKQNSASIKNFNANYEEKHLSNNFFFINGNDARLKDGVEFFQRQKSLVGIREDWMQNRDYVLDLFKRRQKDDKRKFRSKSKRFKKSFKFKK